VLLCGQLIRESELRILIRHLVIIYFREDQFMLLNGMSQLNKKYPKITLVIINVVLFILLFGIIEIVLKSFAPFYIATIGHQFSENATKYGWGYNPHELLKVLDPDTGETYVSYANNNGWRDRDRQYDNKNNAYRILVLGDSVTYGPVVPAEKVYTRILENELQKNGYNIEVINIAYGGWGTDQELEALVNEGVKYKPNLIIVQFCKNDLKDNTYYNDAVNKKESHWKNPIGLKPFYYELDEKNVLHRRENLYFQKSEPKTLEERIKIIMSYSEIFKRFYAVYLHYSLQEVNNKYNVTSNYNITYNKLINLRMVTGISENSNLYKFLYRNINKKLSFEDLTNAIDSSEYSRNIRNIIYRILETRWFNNFWSIDDYIPCYENPRSYDWRLYFALIDEIKKQARLIGADVAIFSESEEGSYQWGLSWYKVKADKASRINYLSSIQIIRTAMREKGVDVIDNTTPYQRARNDPHPNIEGNQSMANDILKYLMLHKKELAVYRNIKNR